jgi:hypothetical protein
LVVYVVFVVTGEREIMDYLDLAQKALDGHRASAGSDAPRAPEPPQPGSSASSSPDADNAAAELLADIRAKGFYLAGDGDYLMVNPSSMLSDHDKEAVRRHKRDLLDILWAERQAQGQQPEAKPVPSWPPDTADLIAWFQAHRDKLPQKPFRLAAWVAVDKPARLYQSLERDISDGPQGARARGLVADLRLLRQHMSAKRARQ